MTNAELRQVNRRELRNALIFNTSS